MIAGHSYGFFIRPPNRWLFPRRAECEQRLLAIYAIQAVVSSSFPYCAAIAEALPHVAFVFNEDMRRTIANCRCRVAEAAVGRCRSSRCDASRSILGM
jgi:hypothetical protein